MTAYNRLPPGASHPYVYLACDGCGDTTPTVWANRKWDSYALCEAADWAVDHGWVVVDNYGVEAWCKKCKRKEH